MLLKRRSQGDIDKKIEGKEGNKRENGHTIRKGIKGQSIRKVIWVEIWDEMGSSR